MEDCDDLDNMELCEQKLLKYTSEAIHDILFFHSYTLNSIDDLTIIQDNFNELLPEKKTEIKEKINEYKKNEKNYNKKDQKIALMTKNGELKKSMKKEINEIYIKKNDEKYIIIVSDKWENLLSRIETIIKNKKDYPANEPLIKYTIFKILLFFEYEYKRSNDTERQKFFADLLQRLKEVGTEYNVPTVQMKETFKSLPGGVRLGNPEPVIIMSKFYVNLIDSLNKTTEDIGLNDENQTSHGKQWMMSLEEGDVPVRKDLGGEDDFGFETDPNDLDPIELDTGEINFDRVVGGKRRTRKRKHFSKKHFSKKCRKTLRRKHFSKKCRKTLRRKCKKTLKRKYKKTLRRKHVRR
jgi:hypothetical protein